MLKDINDISEIKSTYLLDGRKRLTNPICATKNPLNEGNESDIDRYNLLHKIFDKDVTIVEYDTNASIYRLSYALGNKKLINHDEDIYKKIFEACE